MKSSPLSLGLLMMAFGTMLVFFTRQEGVTPPLTTIIAGSGLVGAGLLLFLRRNFAYWVALVAALLTVGMALASYVVHRVLVPMPPVALVVGLLIAVRILFAQSIERRHKKLGASEASEASELEPPGE